VRVCGLISIVLFCAACCATPSKSAGPRYIVNLVIYPDKSCIFVSAAELPDLVVKPGLKPSDAFLKVACGYYLAIYRTGTPDSNAAPSAESVGWYANNPDVPRYIPKVEM